MTRASDKTTGAVAAGGGGERKRGGLWWIWPLLALLAVVLVFLFLLLRGGSDEDTTGKAPAAATATATTAPAAAAATATATATADSTGAAGAGSDGKLSAGGAELLPVEGADIAAQVGSAAEGKGVTVQKIVDGQGFWVGTSATDRRYVEFGGDVGKDEQPASDVKLAVGDTVDLSGEVRRAPEDPAQTLNLDATSADLVSTQGAYVNATSVNPVK